MSVLNKLRWSVGQRGWRGTARAVAKSVVRRLRGSTSDADRVHPFDARYRTETGGLITGAELASGHKHDLYVTGYAGIPPSRFVAALERWSAELDGRRVEEFSFVDLGCGKGRAVLLASEWPFKQVLGVELNPGLARLAESNAMKWQAAGLEQSPVRVVCGDATEVELPSGPLLVFLYNAFSEPVMRLVAKRLRERAAKGGGPVDVIYQNAEFGAVLADEGMKKRWETRLPLSEEDAADPVASPEDVTVMYSVG